MMKTQVADATLFASSNPHIAKRTHVPGIALSLCMLLAGVVLFVWVCLSELHSSTVTMACMVTGTALFLWGVFRLFWRSVYRVYTPTGSAVRERTLYFSADDLNRLVDRFENRHGEAAADVRTTAHGGVRMEVLASKDGRFAAVQLFQYVPHLYTPVTPICIYEGDDAAIVTDFLAQC